MMLCSFAIGPLKERAAKRGDILQFTVPQLRTKLKKGISDCKRVALTMKTATGIKRFQEERGFGKWFNMLFPLVKSRDSERIAYGTNYDEHLS